MTEIEKTLENHQVRPTAMRILIYKYLAEKEIAVALTDIESAFAKAENIILASSITSPFLIMSIPKSR